MESDPFQNQAPLTGTDRDQVPGVGCGLDVAVNKLEQTRQVERGSCCGYGQIGNKRAGVWYGYQSSKHSPTPAVQGLLSSGEKGGHGQRASQVPALRIWLRHRLLPNLETQETLATAVGTPIAGFRQESPHQPSFGIFES